ncbi:MAG: hypothetical protein ACREKM_08135 [Longimicrobiales bacterium]
MVIAMLQRSVNAPGVLRVALALALLAPVLTNRARSQGTPQASHSPIVVQVQLNGQPFASGIFSDRGERRLLIAVADLRAAIDGSDAEARLGVRGSALYAIGRGGCRGCLLRVNRTVMISPALETVEGRLYVPIADVVRAFEGRLESAGDTYAIHVGVCSWCILEPIERQP